MNTGGSDAQCSQPGILAVIEEFEKVLGGHISDSDDFFVRGGSSLLAVRLAAGLTTRFGKRLTLADILRLRTPASIASRLESAPGAPEDPLPQITAKDTYELSPWQRWYSRVYSGRLHPTGVMSFVVELPGGTALPAVRTALESLLRRHDCLRMAAGEADGGLVQWPVTDVVQAVRSAVNTVSSGNDDGQWLAQSVMETCEAQGIAADGGLQWRATLVTAEDAGLPAYLVVIIHHVVFDGASIPIFIRELLAFLRNPDESLPPTASYLSYTAWRLSREPSARHNSGNHWWNDRLAGIKARYHLPISRDRGAYAGYASGMTLPEQVCRDAADAAMRAMVPVSAVRMAAYFVLCHAVYDVSDMVIGMPVEVRDHSAVRGAIGMFINFVLLRHEIKADESAGDLIREVAGELTGVVEHKDHSFGLIMDDLRDLCEYGRFPITGAVINAVAVDAPDGPPLGEPRTTGLRRCNVCDFQVFFVDAPDRTDVELQHRSDILSPKAGASLLACYIEVLSQVARRPDVSVRSLVTQARGSVQGITQVGA